VGANDLCGWDGVLTPTATFRAQFTETLDILRTGLAGAHVFVASIPNLHQLCRFDNYLTYDYAFTKDMVSRLDFFHPSLRGQANLAALTWLASWWGS
jgi:hypothetical protein